MSSPDDLKKTALHPVHVELGARMVPFAGWSMPVHYRDGIIAEHLHTRRSGGLFDVSHMGRFWFTGPQAGDFLQHVLTHNVASLKVRRAQYNLIAYEGGGTVDDSYLYRLGEETYLLVVNAANREKDYDHLEDELRGFGEGVALDDRTMDVVMLALQGPETERVMTALLGQLGIEGELPPAGRNALRTLRWGEDEVHVARTGYTGEPICFELFAPNSRAEELWRALLADEAVAPVGLGARNTLRLEAGLPLYGDELSREITGLEAGLHKLAIRLIDTPTDFVGRDSLREDYLAGRGRRIYRFVINGRGRSPREGDLVYRDGERLGVVTSASAIPHFVPGGEGDTEMRRVGFALVDRPCRAGFHVGADRRYGDLVEVRRAREGRPEQTIGTAEVVRELVRVSDDRTRLDPVLYPPRPPEEGREERYREAAARFVARARENHRWRQERCMNLIASENTPSDFVRWASALDPCGRYAEHQATGQGQLYYYQGTDWIEEVEQRVAREMRLLFGAMNVELRPVSGQMANETVFEAMVRFRTFKRRTEELRISRMSRVINHALPLGGHLSSQPLGALYNYVEQDEEGNPCVTPFPVRADYPYAIDVEALAPIIEKERPELLIFGKSMILEPEPIAEVRALIEPMHPEERPVILYDMAHVLGLAGPLFQDPFADGADVVTGSTHKTFFGPQRGVVLTSIEESFERRRFLWEFMCKAAFPGATSNHHLGTLQGLLAAAYEYRVFGRPYQEAIHTCARAFATALADCGLSVEGDATRGYTQTHQVLLDVGAGRGREMARRLQENNVICNFQGLPGDASFRESRGLRLGVQEMVRFGMDPGAFGELAALMADCILRGKAIGEEVAALRSRFLEMQFCFQGLELEAPPA